jgi:hypothetical protein
MRAKKEINIFAATVPKQFGQEQATRLGFSKSEWLSLWWLALYPKHVTEQFDEARRTALLETISRKPGEAAQLIKAIRNHKERKKDSVIRNVLLDLRANPPNWTLSDSEIADKVCQKLKRKMKEKRFSNLTANVKKQRQLLAKQFPAAKGKT